jgi:hypothetical protein
MDFFCLNSIYYKRVPKFPVPTPSPDPRVVFWTHELRYADDVYQQAEGRVGLLGYKEYFSIIPSSQ